MKRLDQGHLHPLIEHPETNMSQPGIEPSESFGPQMALAYRLDAIFHRAQKLSNSRVQPPPTCPSNGYARIQNITHGAV